MSASAIAVSVMPLIFVVLLVLECSRLRCACQAPRRPKAGKTAAVDKGKCGGLPRCVTADALRDAGAAVYYGVDER